jgi:AcrR family transcriptional regulator
VVIRVGENPVSQAVAERVRRTQAERSATTRARLLDATLECLCDLGYTRTTTPEIARRAGLSRGAQLHHFPTKAELVTGAVERLFERRHAEFRAAFARVPASADRYAAAIDILWSMVSGPTFHAWLELAVAARSDPELRRAVHDLTQRLRLLVDETFRDLFPVGKPDDPFFAIAPRFAFALLDGLALERISGVAETELAQVINGLKALAGLVMPRPEDPK